MNVAELKAELAKYPDDWRITVPDPTDETNVEAAEQGKPIYHCRAGAVTSPKHGWVQIEADLPELKTVEQSPKLRECSACMHPYHTRKGDCVFSTSQTADTIASEQSKAPETQAQGDQGTVLDVAAGIDAPDDPGQAYRCECFKDGSVLDASCFYERPR